MDDEEGFSSIGKKGKRAVVDTASRSPPVQMLFDVMGENMLGDRTLAHEPTIVKLATRFFPHKLKLQVLHSIFERFVSVLDKHPQKILQIQSSVPILSPEPVSFEFESRMWTGTLQCGEFIYENRLVKFVNVKIPNDGYIYSSTYCENSNEGSSVDDIADSDESQLVVQNILSRLQSWVPWLCGEIEITVNYKLELNRFELYFWKMPTKDECVTVKFENGVYENFVNKKIFTLRKLEKIVGV